MYDNSYVICILCSLEIIKIPGDNQKGNFK